MPTRSARPALGAGLAAAALAALLAAAPAAAQQGPPPGAIVSDPTTTVVARVAGEEVYLAEILEMAHGLPDEYKRMPLPAVYPALLQRAVDARLIARAGRAAGYAENEQVKSRLRAVEGRIVSEVFVNDRVRAKVTEEAVRAEYEARKDELAGGDQVKARHILLETEEDARAIVEELAQGADFAELAADRSVGPSAEKGGDLGWFGQGQMVEEFAGAAFALAPGDITTEPVKTQFGWHVILVEDRRDAAPPPFEEARRRLEGEMAQRVLVDILQGLHETTEIERFNYDGGPYPKAPER